MPCCQTNRTTAMRQALELALPELETLRACNTDLDGNAESLHRIEGVIYRVKMALTPRSMPRLTTKRQETINSCI